MCHYHYQFRESRPTHRDHEGINYHLFEHDGVILYTKHDGSIHLLFSLLQILWRLSDQCSPMAASNFNTTDINSSQRINSRRRLSTGTLRLPPTSREALVAKRGPPLSYDYVLRVLSAASNPLDVTHTQHVDPTPSVTTNISLLRPAAKLYFDKTELQQMGVLELPVANCYLLTNKIHPIFGRQNFENTWHHFWPHVQQILRLASRFIDDEAVLPFWHALLFERRPRSSTYRELCSRTLLCRRTPQPPTDGEDKNLSATLRRIRSAQNWLLHGSRVGMPRLLLERHG